jgi:hypothetical protein
VVSNVAIFIFKSKFLDRSKKATGWISLPVASQQTNSDEVSGRAVNGHANEDFALKENYHEFLLYTIEFVDGLAAPQGRRPREPQKRQPSRNIIYLLTLN